MESDDPDDLEAAIDRVRREIYLEQRDLVDFADTLGIAVVTIGVPIMLWDHIPHGRLLVWSALLFMGALSWLSGVAPPGSDRLAVRLVRGVWIWGSSVLWAALPWLSPGTVTDDTVAWILTVVVIYGIASDIVFVPQTFATKLNWMVAGYSSSYLIAFAVASQVGPLLATGATLALLTFGGRGWQQLMANLIEKRVEGERRALIDDLTGIGSRARAVAAIERLRTSPTTEIHCAFLDVDDFKQLNDTYGYDTGDQALHQIAAKLRAVLPADWTCARFGGDEFVAVGPQHFDLSDLSDVDVPLPESFGGTVLTLQLSIGATRLPSATATASDLFREAGAALRRAKQAGKHTTVTMTSELRAIEAERTALGASVSNALEEGKIVAYSQAITDLRTGDSIGMELLARWPQPDGTMVMPNDFVPIIEEQGRGPQLGLVMIDHAIEVLSALKDKDDGCFVTVNLSARHLFHRTLPHEVRDKLAAANLSPSKLVLEITESQHLPQSTIWQATAEHLRELGVGLAIDDFGTGYSSMEQMLSMPFSHLKVDRIVTSAFARPGASDLAAAIVAMARGAGMVTIAEGIETEEERDQMLSAGYIYGQGYLYSRPQPVADFLIALSSREHGSHVV